MKNGDIFEGHFENNKTTGFGRYISVQHSVAIISEFNSSFEVAEAMPITVLFKDGGGLFKGSLEG